MTDGAYREIKSGVQRIEAAVAEMKTDIGERLTRVEDQVKFTNGKVTKQGENAAELYGFNRDRENAQTRLEGKVEQVTKDVETLKTCVGNTTDFRNRMGGMASLWQPITTICAISIAALALVLK